MDRDPPGRARGPAPDHVIRPPFGSRSQNRQGLQGPASTTDKQRQVEVGLGISSQARPRVDENRAAPTEVDDGMDP